MSTDPVMSNGVHLTGERLTGERGGVLIPLLVIAGLITAAVVLLYTVFGTVVPPDKIGVRRNYFSFGFLHEGYNPIGLKPGLHLKFPGISEIILLPRTFQIVNINQEQQEGDLSVGALEVPTTDGSKVNTDITLIVRLFEAPGEVPQTAQAPVSSETVNNLEIPFHERTGPLVHGGPDSLITTYREKPVGQLERVAQVAGDELRRSMSQLSTTDFYDPKLRESAAIQAQQSMNEALTPRGIEVWSTLVRRYTYADPEIDQRIFQKNLQFQTEKYRAAATKFAEAEAAIKKTEAHWQAQIRDLEVGAEAYLIKAESEARLYEESKVAEGTQLLRAKQAEVVAQQNQLLAKMPGAEVYLAREMVPLISTIGGGIVTGVDPFDIDAWVRRLTGHGRAAAEAAGKPAQAAPAVTQPSAPAP